MNQDLSFDQLGSILIGFFMMPFFMAGLFAFIYFGNIVLNVLLFFAGGKGPTLIAWWKPRTVLWGSYWLSIFPSVAIGPVVYGGAGGPATLTVTPIFVLYTVLNLAVITAVGIGLRKLTCSS